MSNTTSTIERRYHAPALHALRHFTWASSDPADVAGQPYRHHSLTAPFSPEQARDVEALAIVVGEQLATPDALPLLAELQRLSRLKYLDVPADLLQYVDPQVLRKLRYLTISRPCNDVAYQNILAAKSFLVPDQDYPDLEILNFYFPLVFIKNFSQARFPSLRWAAMELETMDKPGRSLDLLQDYDRFDGCSLRSIKDAKLLARLRKESALNNSVLSRRPLGDCRQRRPVQQ
jgi:hypothetical protein